MEEVRTGGYPHELVDLFHRSRNSRRDFLEHAGKFATGGLTAAAIFESLNSTEAQFLQVRKKLQEREVDARNARRAQVQFLELRKRRETLQASIAQHRVAQIEYT